MKRVKLFNCLGLDDEPVFHEHVDPQVVRKSLPFAGDGHRHLLLHTMAHVLQFGQQTDPAHTF